MVVAELTDTHDLRAVVSKGLERVASLSSSSKVMGASSVTVDPGDIVGLYLRCRQLAEVSVCCVKSYGVFVRWIVGIRA